MNGESRVPEGDPTPETPAKKSEESLDHPAIAAANSTLGIWAYMWEQCIRGTAKRMAEFSADDVQLAYELPSIGNATGGIFMRLHRGHVIRRVGYRPSTAKSRSGGVVSIWAAGDAL